LEQLPDLIIDIPFAPKLVATTIGTLIADNKLTLAYPSSSLSALISTGPAPGYAALMASEILRAALAGGKDIPEKESSEFLLRFARTGRKAGNAFVGTEEARKIGEARLAEEGDLTGREQKERRSCERNQ
jgi:hypothetical protein